MKDNEKAIILTAFFCTFVGIALGRGCGYEDRRILKDQLTECTDSMDTVQKARKLTDERLLECEKLCQ